MSIFLDKTLILNKIKLHYNFKTNADFAAFLGIAPTTLSSWYSRNSIDYELISSKCVEIDANWLLTGEGEIAKTSIGVLAEPVVLFSRKKNKDVNHSEQRIPLYNIEAAAGVVAIFENLHKQTPEAYLEIPNLPTCDGAVKIVGDSMYPLLKSGDIVVYKILNNLDNIFWGEMYLLSIVSDGDSYIIVKYVQKSDKDGYVKLVSQNQHHQDKEMPYDSIKFAALIKASIRINSMG